MRPMRVGKFREAKTLQIGSTGLRVLPAGAYNNEE